MESVVAGTVSRAPQLHFGKPRQINSNFGEVSNSGRTWSPATALHGQFRIRAHPTVHDPFSSTVSFLSVDSSLLPFCPFMRLDRCRHPSDRDCRRICSPSGRASASITIVQFSASITAPILRLDRRRLPAILFPAVMSAAGKAANGILSTWLNYAPGFRILI
jgi:hypothetical protein